MALLKFGLNELKADAMGFAPLYPSYAATKYS